MKHCSEMKRTILHIKNPGGYIESRRDNSRGETYKPLIPPNITRFKRVSVLGNTFIVSVKRAVKGLYCGLTGGRKKRALHGIRWGVFDTRHALIIGGSVL